MMKNKIIIILEKTVLLITIFLMFFTNTNVYAKSEKIEVEGKDSSNTNTISKKVIDGFEAGVKKGETITYEFTVNTILLGTYEWSVLSPKNCEYKIKSNEKSCEVTFTATGNNGDKASARIRCLVKNFNKTLVNPTIDIGFTISKKKAAASEENEEVDIQSPSDDWLGESDTLDDYIGSGGNSKKIEKKAEKALGVIRVIGIVLSVVMLMIIGIKYMLGSAEQKADYKKTLIPYIIGALIIFTGSILPQIIYQFVQNIKDAF